ncbi:hypothetical protein OE88DRAFT_1661361 [Heliocybe sulcata]|uniref:Uncharacterized protein n=1 Tax=Heliocybe sulcata TaxID=5364 RepID=A0A5C3MXM3_9AGAM|nr:hypothetical protein OE88DRAFT_1661361 [Heliocybe sulcata]
MGWSGCSRCTRRFCRLWVCTDRIIWKVSIRSHAACADGYVNENGVINTKRLQVVLDEMKEWELEVFSREYADLNWFKGKQSKHVQNMEVAKKRAGQSSWFYHFLAAFLIRVTCCSLDARPKGHL